MVWACTGGKYDTHYRLSKPVPVKVILVVSFTVCYIQPVKIGGITFTNTFDQTCHIRVRLEGGQSTGRGSIGSGKCHVLSLDVGTKEPEVSVIPGFQAQNLISVSILLPS